jgi:hypothetical protein
VDIFGNNIESAEPLNKSGPLVKLTKHSRCTIDLVLSWRSTLAIDPLSEKVHLYVLTLIGNAKLLTNIPSCLMMYLPVRRENIWAAQTITPGSCCRNASSLREFLNLSLMVAAFHRRMSFSVKSIMAWVNFLFLIYFFFLHLHINWDSLVLYRISLCALQVLRVVKGY